MIPHDRLTIIRNRTRVRDLRTFRERVRTYFEQSEYDTPDTPVDWEGVRAARAGIHRMLPRIVQIVQAADLDVTTVALPRSAAGRALEILHGIFSDRYAHGEYQEILDVIDMTVGVYDATRYGALLRTVNPFHYLGAALRYLAGLPFRTLVAFGLVRPRSAPNRPASVTGLDAAVARLADTEGLIERRFADMREWQSRLFAESASQLTDLAERMDFVERVLAQPNTMQRLKAGDPKVRTPV
jgi:hypothetical protein